MSEVKKRIRNIVLGIVQREAHILVQIVEPDEMYRPLGGEIEFGETSTEALIREFDEELNRQIIVKKHLGWLENIFVYAGKKEHELVSIYEIVLIGNISLDSTIHVFEKGNLEDGDSEFDAVWMPISRFLNGNAQIVPDGIIKFIKQV